MTLKYIDRIRRNVLSVKGSSLKHLYDILDEADCVIPYGSGRSYCSIKIPMSQFAKIFPEKVVITPEDPGFPGNNMYEAARKLERRYRKIVLLLNSGSGESQEPLTVAWDLARYIDETGTDRYVIVGITSNPLSSIGSLASEYGLVIELRGRARHEEALDYTTTGIMGDTFELGSLLLVQGVVRALYEGERGRIKAIHRQYLDHVSELIDKHIHSEQYDALVEHLMKRANVFVGGRGSADEVAEMTVIRLSHVKYAIGDHVYQARGANTPRPRPGDLGILISCSGETPTVVRWARTMREEGCTVYSIVGNPESSLARCSDYCIPVEAGNDEGPRDFYMYASYILSPLPIVLIGRLSEAGLRLPERLLRYYHSTVE